MISKEKLDELLRLSKIATKGWDCFSSYIDVELRDEDNLFIGQLGGYEKMIYDAQFICLAREVLPSVVEELIERRKK